MPGYPATIPKPPASTKWRKVEKSGFPEPCKTFHIHFLGPGWESQSTLHLCRSFPTSQCHVSRNSGQPENIQKHLVISIVCIFRSCSGISKLQSQFQKIFRRANSELQDDMGGSWGFRLAAGVGFLVSAFDFHTILFSVVSHPQLLDVALRLCVLGRRRVSEL